MGFFKKLFKRKKGGTFFGNLLRKASSTATGGVLGSGEGLAKWEAKQNQKEFDQAVNQAREQAYKEAKASAVAKYGKQIGNKLKPHVDKALNSNTANDLNKAFTKVWFKKNMAKIIGGVLGTVALISGIVWLLKRKKKGKKLV